MKEAPNLSFKSVMIEGLVECLLKTIIKEYKITEASFYQGYKAPANITIPTMPYYEILDQYFIDNFNILSNDTYFGMYKQLQTIYSNEVIHGAIIRCMFFKDIKYFLKTFEDEDKEPEMRQIEYFAPAKNQEVEFYKLLSDSYPDLYYSLIENINIIVNSDTFFLEKFNSDTIQNENPIFIDYVDNSKINKVYTEKCLSGMLQINNIETKRMADDSFLQNISPIISGLSKANTKFSLENDSNIGSTAMNNEDTVINMGEVVYSRNNSDEVVSLYEIDSEGNLKILQRGEIVYKIFQSKASLVSKKVFMNMCKKEIKEKSITFREVLQFIYILDEKEVIKILCKNTKSMRIELLNKSF